MKILTTSITATFLLAGLCTMAQGRDPELTDGKEERDLPITVHVTENGGKASFLRVSIYKDNQLVTEMPPHKRGSFQLGLDLDSYYAIIVRKEGYRDKLININTNLPEGVERYEAYACNINLEPAERFAHSDPFYLDFPGALVRWDSEKEGFDHSNTYLADIQLKVALLSAQVETQ